MDEIAGLSVIGLGKLGLPVAASFAAGGVPVLGVDRDPDVRESVRRKQPQFFEPGLEELLVRAGERITVTDDIGEVVDRTQATIVLVATPSDAAGRFSLRAVREVLAELGDRLRDKESPHLVVVASTVIPGDLDGDLVPLLEARSGKRVGRDLGLCYCPEFFALGSVLRDFATRISSSSASLTRIPGTHLRGSTGACAPTSPPSFGRTSSMPSWPSSP